MKAKPVRYVYKGVDRGIRWEVLWSEKGKAKSKWFATERKANAWMRTKKKLLEEMSGAEITDWEAVSVDNRRAILAAQTAFLEAGKMDKKGVLPWRDAATAYITQGTTKESLLLKNVAADLMEAKKRSAEKGNIGADWLYVSSTCFNKIVRRFGDSLMSKMPWQEIEGWMQEDDWEPTTFNHYRAFFIELYKWAQNDHPTLPTPMGRIERYKIVPSEEPVPSPEIVKKAFLAVIAARNWPLLATMVLGFGFGIRNAEIGKLSWSGISSDWIKLYAEITKTKDRRVIEVRPEFTPAFDLLASISEKKGLIAPPRWGEQRLKVLQDANFRRTRNIMRRTFVSYYVAFTSDIGRVRQIIGHSDASSTLEKNYKALEVYGVKDSRPLTQADAQAYFAMFQEVQQALVEARSVNSP